MRDGPHPRCANAKADCGQATSQWILGTMGAAAVVLEEHWPRRGPAAVDPWYIEQLSAGGWALLIMFARVMRPRRWWCHSATNLEVPLGSGRGAGPRQSASVRRPKADRAFLPRHLRLPHRPHPFVDPSRYYYHRPPFFARHLPSPKLCLSSA